MLFVVNSHLICLAVRLLVSASTNNELTLYKCCCCEFMADADNSVSTVEKLLISDNG